MLPLNILGVWFRGLLALGIIAGGVALAAGWYRDLPADVVVREGGPDGPREVRIPLGAWDRVTAWRPGLDAPTAMLVGAVVLLLAAAAGRPILALGSGDRPAPDDELTLTGGEARRLRRPDGTELHVEAFGPVGAPAVVLTHGWGIDANEWAHPARALARTHRVLAWDLPGLGRSSRAANNDYSVERFAGDLRAVVELADGPAVLAGHSIGGMITLTFCRLFPETLGREVAGVALVHTTPTNPVRTTKHAALYMAIQKPVIEPLLHLTVWLSPLVWLMNCLSYFNGSAHNSMRRQSFAGTQTRAQVEYGARQYLKVSPAVAARGMLGMLRYDATGVLPAVGVPALVVAGERDTMTTPAASVAMATALPQARLVTLAPARHQGFLERHAEFDAQLASFAGAAAATGAHA
jgi:pimeloyl-ACP methyl ester carboxylesterase